MDAPRWVDLALLPEVEAERRHFDASNARTSRFFWYFFVVYSAVAGLVGAASRQPLQALAAIASLAALLLVARSRGTDAFRRLFAPVLLALTGGQILLWMLLADEAPATVTFGVLVVPTLLIALRLRAAEAFALAAVAAVAAGLQGWLAPPSTEREMPALAAMASVGIISFLGATIGLAVTRRRRSELFAELGRVRSDAHERLRMREELESARTIQLSMLPREAPDLPWLEVAAVCLPAHEVGGDYYDYFVLGPDQLAVVVGDVAGHGVSAGIVLSGVRACLHLLAEELERPEAVLSRLNRVVRETGPERLLMSLGVALFGRAPGTVRWVSAGHPPALGWSARTGAVRALEGHQPPLGTRLPVSYAGVEAALEPGDVWLLGTDGAAEALDAAGEPFGEAALAVALATAAARPELPASGVLEQLLAAIAGHRAGRAADDDLTLTVIRCRT